MLRSDPIINFDFIKSWISPWGGITNGPPNGRGGGLKFFSQITSGGLSFSCPKGILLLPICRIFCGRDPLTPPPWPLNTRISLYIALNSYCRLMRVHYTHYMLESADCGKWLHFPTCRRKGLNFSTHCERAGG